MESKRKEKEDMVEWRNEKGQLHRLDGPAVEWNNGTKFWYINGKLHREDGPAVEWNSRASEWYLNGEHYSEERWKEELLELKLNRIKEL